MPYEASCSRLPSSLPVKREQPGGEVQGAESEQARHIFDASSFAQGFLTDPCAYGERLDAGLPVEVGLGEDVAKDQPASGRRLRSIGVGDEQVLRTKAGTGAPQTYLAPSPVAGSRSGMPASTSEGCSGSLAPVSGPEHLAPRLAS